MNPRYLLPVLAALFVCLLNPGCATKDPDDYERDDYFGGHGNLIRPKHHVPSQVVRY